MIFVAVVVRFDAVIRLFVTPSRSFLCIKQSEVPWKCLSRCRCYLVDFYQFFSSFYSVTIWLFIFVVNETIVRVSIIYRLEYVRVCVYCANKRKSPVVAFSLNCLFCIRFQSHFITQRSLLAGALIYSFALLLFKKTCSYWKFVLIYFTYSFVLSFLFYLLREVRDLF